MRFFKIFIVTFLSFIASLGVILGVMYLTGYFNKPVVSPEAIYFELPQNETEFNFSTDSYIKVMTSTEEVTQTKITLSLGNEQSSVVDGVTYITNGIIQVPKFVTLGQAFNVQLVKAPNAELGGEEWIVGGVSTLTAKSESLFANQISVNVNVDVPVKNIQVVTYANDTFSQPLTSFATGETFYAKATFSPQASLYKFAQDGSNNKPAVMKKVYFDIITVSSQTLVQENQEINALLQTQGITNISAFDCLQANSSVAVNAYAFATATLEDKAIATSGGDLDEILAELKTSNTGTSATKNIEIKNLTIRSFIIAENLTPKSLVFNRVNKLYANYGQSNEALNFGIEISDAINSDLPNLQSKIKNVGLKVYYKPASVWLEATNQQFLIVDALGQTLSPTADGYYLPNAVAADVNKSFWNFVPLLQNTEYAFELCILTDQQVPDTSIESVNTYTSGSQQIWQSADVVGSTIQWTTSQDINLTVIDSVEIQNVQSEEFDISTILSFNEGTYNIIRYIAYSANQEDLAALLPNCIETTKYAPNKLGLADNTRIFELTSPIIKPQPSNISKFYVKAVVLVSDHLNRLDPSYTIYDSTAPIAVNVEKTVKNLSAKIVVDDASLLKNLNEDTNVLSELAFVAGTGENIFDIVFTVTADNQTALEKEKQIFLAALENGKINIINYFFSESQPVIRSQSGVGALISDTQWTYTISYFAGNITADANIYFGFEYEKTDLVTTSQYISAVEFGANFQATFDNTVQMAEIELYDGKIFSLEFAYDNDINTPISQTTTITGDVPCGQTAFFAQEVSREYRLNGEIVEDVVDEQTGKFKIVAKDKFGNIVSAQNCTYQSWGDIDTQSTYYLLTTETFSSALVTSPTDKLYYLEDNTTTSAVVSKNVGQIDLGVWSSSDITKDADNGGFQTVSAQEALNEITISRYGIIGGTIQITGQNGLLGVRFAQNQTVFELCNILEYTFSGTLPEALSYDNQTGAITILKTIGGLNGGSKITLSLTANTKLGEQYSIKLEILPNISVEFHRLTAQGTLDETISIDNQDHLWVYSDNPVNIGVKVKYNLLEEVDLMLSAGLFGSGDNVVRPQPNFSQQSMQATAELEFAITFAKEKLGKQTITLSAGQGAYAFVANINFLVEANISFAGDVESLTKSIQISALQSGTAVLEANDVQRIVPGAELTLQDLSISFEKTTDGTFIDRVYRNNEDSPLAQNIFVWDNTNKNLKATSKLLAQFDMNAEYTAYLVVKYGTQTVGTVKVLISSIIAPDQNNPDFLKRFAYFDNQLVLVLQSGEIGITTSYIQSLFANVGDVDLTVDQNNIVATDETTFNVAQTTNFVVLNNNKVNLVLKHLANDANQTVVAEITFPILISPYGVKYVSYQNQPPFNGASLGLSDLSSLKDYTRLNAENVFDEYKSGEDINLFASTNKTNGLSQEIHTKITNGTFGFAVFKQGANGQIGEEEYEGLFVHSTGILKTILSSQNSFIYCVVYDMQQENIIGLYRIKLLANAKINVYYPYAAGAYESGDTKEYVYETLGETIEIDFAEAFAQNMPNFGKSRIQLEVQNPQTQVFEPTTQTHKITYSLYQVNGIMAEGNLASIRSNYGIYFDADAPSVLTIYCQNDPYRNFDIVVCASVQIGTVDIGFVYYTINLNSTQKALYKLAVGTQDYTTTTQTIESGEAYDISNIKLIKTDGNISSPALDVDLGVHYFVENQNTHDFVSLQDKKLSLKDTAVSNKLVSVVFFTVYGTLHTINLTFVSDYDFNLSNNQTKVSFNPQTNHYEVLGDTEFSLKGTFQITSSGQAIALDDVEFEYFDNGQKTSSDVIVFKLISSAVETHNLKVIAKLSQSQSIGVSEDYVFEIVIDVLQSIKSNFAQSPKNLGEVTYDTSFKTTGLVFDNLLATNLSNTNALFAAANQDVLADYVLSVSINQNALGFVSLSKSENILQETYTSDQLFAMAQNATLYVLKSPSKKLDVEITFFLTKTYEDTTQKTISSSLRFSVLPDIAVSLFYPQANQNSALQEEHIFLDANYYNGSQNRFLFDFAKANDAYFDTTRLSLTSDSSIDENRLAIKASSESQFILINGQKVSEFAFDEVCEINWNTTSAFAGEMSAAVNFEVLIDGESHATYVVVFDNNIQNIFEVSNIKNLYQNAQENSLSNPEQFLVDAQQSEAIFSNKTALLTFTNQSQTQNITLIAFVKSENSKFELGKITIGAKRTQHNWLLTNKNVGILPDLSNIVIMKEGDAKEYIFGTDLSDEQSVYHPGNFFEQFASVSYRLTVKYLGQELEYSKMASIVDVAGSSKTDRFCVDREIAQSQTVQFAIQGQALETAYHYHVVYDFKATTAFSTSINQTNNSNIQSLRAPASFANNANAQFGISALDGTAFNKEYFDKHDVNYFAEIVMITNSEFETNPVQQNIKFLPAAKTWFMQQYFENITGPASGVLCAGIGPKGNNDNSILWDFDMTAYGAENDGNFVYVLVSYAANEDAKGTITQANIQNFAYALIKVQILPNTNSIVLLNPDGFENGEAEDSRLEITYDQTGKFADILLGTYDAQRSDNNLIYVFGTGTKNQICDTSGSYSSYLSLHGDIANYVELYKFGTSMYLKQKANTIANFGDQAGYIKIEDMFGYSKNYYLTIKAANTDDALSLVEMEDGGTFINTIPNTENAFFSSSQLVLVDENAEVNLGELSAIRIKNLDKLSNKVYASSINDVWAYQVSYRIVELGYSYDNPVFTGVDAPQTSLILPSITKSELEVTLYIIVTISHNGLQEVVTLATSLKIEKRFSLTFDDSSTVQAGVGFDVSTFLNVQDEANVGVSLGSAEVSDDMITLKVSAANEYLGKTITFKAINTVDSTLSKFNEKITIGKTFEGQTMAATNGYYYYILSLHPALVGIDFKDYTFTVQSDEISVQDACQFIADKTISLTTSSVNSAPTVYVHVHNTEVAFAVPFALSKNGLQVKSLAEVTASGTLKTSVGLQPATQNLPQIDQLGTSSAAINSQSSIYDFTLASTPVSAEDLKLIKNFEIYDDSLCLEISKPATVQDLTQIPIVVSISQSGQFLGSQTFKLTQNIPHFRYISVSTIIGDQIDVSKTYDVEISYSLDSGSVASIIAYNGAVSKVQQVQNFEYPYVLKSTFEFHEIKVDDKEVLDVMSKDAFLNKMHQTSKAYLVKYLDQNVYESAPIVFNITPKYYGVETQGSESIKYIYANQYIIENGHYKVNFNTWASGFNLVNPAGNILAALSAADDLIFKINDGAGLGAGTATLDANNNLITTSQYKEGHDFEIEVWVPVNAQEEICIGSVHIAFQHSQVFVATPSTYMFIITYPGELDTIEPSYDFKETVTSIDDLIFNNPSQQLKNKVDPESKTIEIAGLYRMISECNIQIVTVVEQIYSAEYVVKEHNGAENAYLELKIKLNETSSTADKSVTVEVLAKSKAQNISVGTKTLNLDIHLNNQSQGLEFTISAGQGTLCERAPNGIYTVDIPFEMVYTSIIGEDHNFFVEVQSTNSTNAELLYAVRTQSQSEFAIDETLFFALSFIDQSGTEHYTLLATKNTQNSDQLFETDGYFAINISSLEQTGIDNVDVLSVENGVYKNNVSCYSIKFLGAYDFDLANNDILLVSQNADQTNFSIAKVLQSPAITDPAQSHLAFEIAINSQDIYNQVISSSNEITLVEYSNDVYIDAAGNYLPKVVPLDVKAGSNYFSLYTNNASQSKILGIYSQTLQTVAAKIDYSWFSEGAASLAISDVSEGFDNVNLQALTQAAHFMQTGPYQCAIAKTDVQATDFSSHTQYVFGFNVLYGATKVSFVDQIDLTSLVSNPQSGKYYAFSMQLDDVVTHFALQANASNKILLSPEDVLSGNGLYVFTLQNIEFENLQAGTTTFALYDVQDKLIGATATNVVQSGSALVFEDNVLKNAAFAQQGPKIEIQIAAQTMTYIQTNLQNTKILNAVYFDASDIFEIDLASLLPGATLQISVSNTGFLHVDAADSVILNVHANQNARTFTASVDGNLKTIEIAENQTQKTISLAEFEIAILANNLTIYPS